MINVEDVRKKFKFTINYGMSDISLRFCKELNPKGWNSFDFEVFLPTKDKNLQRPLVWTDFQKEQLIISVLKGIKLPVVTVIKHRDRDKDGLETNVYQVIDGKQRLTTLISYMKNEFCINYVGKEIFFKDLHSYLQSDFYNCITSDIGYSYPDRPITDEMKIEWFEMINFAGTPQDIAHLQDLKK